MVCVFFDSLLLLPPPITASNAKLTMRLMLVSKQVAAAAGSTREGSAGARCRIHQQASNCTSPSHPVYGLKELFRFLPKRRAIVSPSRECFKKKKTIVRETTQHMHARSKECRKRFPTELQLVNCMRMLSKKLCFFPSTTVISLY